MNNTKLSLDECYKILGIPSTSTKDEVEKAYKKLLIKYHPDIYASKSEFEQRMAAEKLEEIKNAKNIILNNNTFFSANYNSTNSSYTKDMTKAEYEKAFYEAMSRMAQEFEEMRKRDEEEDKKIKRTIIKLFIISLVNVLVVVYGSDLIKNAFEKPKKNLDDSKINDDISVNKLIKMYTLKESDTLENLAYEANCTVEEIINLNDNIEAGNTIKIPYNVAEEDLEYYTETVDFDGNKLEEVAKEYNTDIETLGKLNSESIINLKIPATVIIGDTLKVPNFITRQELKEQKSEAKVYTK